MPDLGLFSAFGRRWPIARWDFVPAVLRLAAPATIRVLNVSELGFSSRNATELIALIDAGRFGFRKCA